jgi:hypothetical protein
VDNPENRPIISKKQAILEGITQKQAHYHKKWGILKKGFLIG